MVNFFYFSCVEVFPLKGSEMLQSEPTVRGGFVDVVVRAHDLKHARTKLENEMKLDGYIVTSIDWSREFSTLSAEFLKEKQPLIDLVKESSNDEMWYGEFFVYE